MKNQKQIVLDTNVCIDLFVFQDSRWNTLLDGMKTGEIKAITREDCRQEWLAVLHYPHLPVNDETRESCIKAFDAYITCVNPPQKSSLLPRCTDKDDQKFLEIARDANAETLVTKDKALLKLARKIRLAGYYQIETPEKFIANWEQSVRNCR